MIRILECVVRVRLRHPWLGLPSTVLADMIAVFTTDAVLPRLAERLDDTRPMLPRVDVHVAVALGDVLAPTGQPMSVRHRTVPTVGRDLQPGAVFALHEAVEAAVHRAYSQVVHESRPADDPAVHLDSDRATDSVEAEFRRATAGLLLRARQRGYLDALLRVTDASVIAAWQRLFSSSADPTSMAAGVSPTPGSDVRTFRAVLDAADALRSTTTAVEPAVERRSGQRIVPVSSPDRRSVVPGSDAGQTVAEGPSAPGADPPPADSHVWPGTTSLRRHRDGQAGVTAPKSAMSSPELTAISAAEVHRSGPGVAVSETPAGSANLAVTSPDFSSPAPAAPTRPRRHGTVDVATVLPFILFGPLHRMGLLDALTATLLAIGDAHGPATFAAALAGKTLAPPVPGGHRSTEELATVAAAAGLDQPPDGIDFARLASARSLWWPPIQQLIVADLTHRSATGPAIAAGRCGHRRPRGRLPDHIGGTEAETAAVATAFGDPPIATGPSPLVDYVEAMHQRPAGGRHDVAPGLDGPIDVITGIASAAVAWQLWHDREDTHPLLAVRRFADLDGQVTFERDRVLVRMPLGRRHSDLTHSGLLQTVPGIWWYGDRPLELTGG